MTSVKATQPLGAVVPQFLLIFATPGGPPVRLSSECANHDFIFIDCPGFRLFARARECQKDQHGQLLGAHDCTRLDLWGGTSLHLDPLWRWFLILFFYTLALAVISQAICLFITGRSFTLATFYWIGWLLGTAAASLSSTLRLLPAITPVGETALLTFHIGATVGFLLGSAIYWIFFRHRSSSPKPMRVNGLLWISILIEAIMGAYLLYDKITLSGFDIFAFRSSYLTDAYLTDNLPWPLRVYSYVTLVSLAPVAIWANQDRFRNKINGRRIGLAFLASVPGGLSTGGRIWVMQIIATYLISYLITDGIKLRPSQLVKRTLQGLAILLMLGGLFTGLGNLRDVSRGEGKLTVDTGLPTWLQGTLSTFAPLYSYLGVPTIASDSYGRVSQSWWNGKLNGQATFPFLADQAVRIRLLDRNRNLDYIKDVRYRVATGIDIRIGTTHATLIPLLITDFGRSNLLYSSIWFFTIFQMLFLILLRLGDLWHVAATMIAVYGGFLIFQDASIGTASAIIPVISIILLKPLFKARFVWGSRRLTSPNL